eukprot:scpid91196/ scgid9463/ 
MQRTSKKRKNEGKQEASADVDPSSTESVREYRLEKFEKSCRSVQSVFPACKQRDEEFLGFRFQKNSRIRLGYLRHRYSLHNSGLHSGLTDEAEQQHQGQSSNYRTHIPGFFKFKVDGKTLGPATFIKVLQHRLSTFDGLFQEVFGDEPSGGHVKVPAQSHDVLVLGKYPLEEHDVQKGFGFMAQFWYVFHRLQDIIDNIAAHVPGSRKHLCQIASMEMVEVLEMYCSCYDGGLLLLKNDEGHEHTDLKEFSVAAADLFNVSEFLPFFDDAYTILAQFFLIVDMCVGKELSSSA